MRGPNVTVFRSKRRSPNASVASISIRTCLASQKIAVSSGLAVRS
jgi:hypothetical protein